jgi:isopentenyl phosphate kinase
MTKGRKQVFIVKLGGSVVTYKNTKQIKIRRKLLQSIAQEIKTALRSNKNTQIVLVHGAGSAGHILASQYDLKHGVKGEPNKLKAALKIRENNQKLNALIIKIFTEAGLPVVPIHTGSVISQTNGTIEDIHYEMIDMALREGCIPVMYGEMTFDTKIGLSVCSGDEIVTQLAHYLEATKIIYASDIHGVYDLDPYRHRHATMIPEIALEELVSGNIVKLDDSHSIDVTGGLFNKIRLIATRSRSDNLKEVVVMNGLQAHNFSKAIKGNKVGTRISL